ncbi:MAG: cation:proton antiporter [Deltaproteobacteria bacterium]|jgi:Kef-type K+ transport system membrane component KefB|nr:cation:proton antiporter [Deltaproteobacteria bacterium]
MEITLLMALILTAGFIAAKAGQVFRLPSVTGFIAAGVLLGPSGFNVITAEATGNQLRHFTQIALMLIAFGIGEHLELKRLKVTARTVLSICLADTAAALLLVAGAILAVTMVIGAGGPAYYFKDYVVLAIILGTVSIATAPGTILFITRESRAVGPLTTTLLQVVAVNNGLAIVFFGVGLVLARQVVGVDHTLWGTMLTILAKISFSLLLGVATGLIIDFIIHRLRDRGEMLTAGLALLLLCGEMARFLKLSPLLAGIAIGFTIVNRDRRDVRLFRTLNAFEPPIYVLFFTLAGAHLDFSALTIAGWLGFIYFLLRFIGKTVGTYLGGVLADASWQLRKYLGMALIPQAGVAIGLVFLINGDPDLNKYAAILTPTVLVGVLFAELIGPACTKYALEKSGEAVVGNGSGSGVEPVKCDVYFPEEPRDAQLPQWSWEKLTPASSPVGSVVFGVSQESTVGGLARMATLLAHHFRAQPVAVRIDTGKEETDTDISELFAIAAQEARSLGYALHTAEIRAESIAKGIVAAAREKNALTILLGYPFQRTEHSFNKIVEDIAAAASCPITIVRFTGILHTERILVPIISSTDLEVIGDTLCSLAHVGKHHITLLRLLSADVQEDEMATYEKKLYNWAAGKALPFVKCIVTKAEARLEEILKQALCYDFVIMAVSQGTGIKKLLIGSLADDVAGSCQRPMLIVHRPRL